MAKTDNSNKANVKLPQVHAPTVTTPKTLIKLTTCANTSQKP